jgi:hypothetical protein
MVALCFILVLFAGPGKSKQDWFGMEQYMSMMEEEGLD